MADRVRGIQVHRPIIYGTHSRRLTEEELLTSPPQHTHRWTVFLTSAASPPPKDGELEDINYLPGGADDLSYMIKRVTFKLHDSYTPMSRVLDKPPFQVTETGWGEFDIQIRVQFVGEASEKPLALAHMLKLHHWGPVIEGLNPPTDPTAQAGPSASAAPTPTAAPTGTEEKVDETTAAATATDTPEASGSKPEDEGKEEAGPGNGSGEVIKTEAEASTPALSDSDAPAQSGEIVAQAPAPAGSRNNASNLPVLAWQYDELVFTDPPSAFLDILNENPPTLLPAKLRRPRDQREKDGPAKKKKGRASIIGITSRAQTLEPGASGTPAPTTQAQVGPPLPGSADVPLEFAKEMEVAEFNRLTDIKLHVIDQMDKWRTRLIAQEKELAKLKEEMKIS